MARHKKKKAAAGGNKPGKQVAAEMLPSRFSRAAITGGDVFRRTINDYAKASPADASGVGQIGLNIFSMGRS
jgi:hypothetical protein